MFLIFPLGVTGNLSLLDIYLFVPGAKQMEVVKFESSRHPGETPGNSSCHLAVKAILRANQRFGPCMSFSFLCFPGVDPGANVDLTRAENEPDARATQRHQHSLGLSAGDGSTSLLM